MPFMVKINVALTEQIRRKIGDERVNDMSFPQICFCWYFLNFAFKNSEMC